MSGLFFLNFIIDKRFYSRPFQYELQERKRREAKEASSRRKEAVSTISDAARVDRRELRREIWIHPLDGRRTRRTTSANGSPDYNAQNSDDEELAQLQSFEVCVNFGWAKQVYTWVKAMRSWNGWDITTELYMGYRKTTSYCI